MILYIIIAAVAGAVLALALYIGITRIAAKGRGDAIIQKATLEAESLKQKKMLEAKEHFLQLKEEHENKVNEKNNQLRDRENNVRAKETQLNQLQSELGRRQHDLDSQKGQLNAQRDQLSKKEAECAALIAQANKQLETVAGMSAEEAKKMLVENMKAEARSEALSYINDTMDEARLNAAKEAKRIVINTIQRTATETAIENGADILLFTKDLEEDVRYMKEGIQSGRLSRKRLDEAVTRILAVKAAMKLPEKKADGTIFRNGDDRRVIACEEHVNWAKECADKGITLVKDTVSLLPLSVQKHKRVLFELLGDFPSNDRVKAQFISLLEKEGFEVTEYVPETLETIFEDSEVETFKSKYDLVLYVGNIENASNKTTARINWHTLFPVRRRKQYSLVCTGGSNPVYQRRKSLPSAGCSDDPYLYQRLLPLALCDRRRGGKDHGTQRIQGDLTGGSVLRIMGH